MNYRRFTLSIKEPGEWQNVFQELAIFPEWIMVNVSSAADDAGVLFLPKHVQELLASGLRTLHLEGVPQAEYYTALLEQTSLFLDLGVSLRERLRLWRTGQVQNEVQDYLNRVQNLLQFIAGHDCQQPSLLPAPVFSALQYAIEQLAVSAFYQEDNVRCMDHLQYELAPCLMELRERIGQRLAAPVAGGLV